MKSRFYLFLVTVVTLICSADLHASSSWIFFHGGMNSGIFTAPAYPSGSDSSPKSTTGYNFGLGIDLAVSPELTVFFDGGLYRRSTPVADNGGYAQSFWVYEQTGYSSHQVGPFATEVRAYLDTTGIRAGLKYAFLPESNFRPWIGLGFGVYRWTFSFLNDDRTKTYGSETGITTGLTYLGGVQLVIDEKTSIDFFADLTSPVIFPEFKNLFNQGWTWINSGGNHVMGPYRFGVALRFAP